MALNGKARLEAFLVCLVSPVATRRAFAPTGSFHASCPAAPTAAPCRTGGARVLGRNMLHHIAPCCTMLHHVAPCSRAEQSPYQLFRSTDSGAMIRKGPEICLTSNCAAAKLSKAKQSRAVRTPWTGALGSALGRRRAGATTRTTRALPPVRQHSRVPRAAESPAQLARVCLPALWDTAGPYRVRER